MADNYKYNIFTDVDLRGNSLNNVKDFNVETAQFDTIEVSESLTSENYTHLKNKVLINRADSAEDSIFKSTEDSILKVDTDVVEIESRNTVDVRTGKLTENTSTKVSTSDTETHNISNTLTYTVGNDSNKVFALEATLDANTEVSKMGIDTLNIRDNEINFGVKNKEESILARDNYNVHIVWDSSTKSLVFQVEEEN